MDPMKLLSFSLDGHNLNGVGVISTVDFTAGKETITPGHCNPGVLAGWVLHLRGPIAYLVSPPGWSRQHSGQPHHWKADGPRMVHSLSRDVIKDLRWSVDAGEALDLDKLVRYDSEPFGSVMAASTMSDDELEKATAPKKR